MNSFKKEGAWGNLGSPGQKQKDLAFGLKKEIEVLEIVKGYFSADLKKCADESFVFDYECPSCYVELKSRRVGVYAYSDTMVGKNKLDYAGRINRPVYFVFSFTNGLYYWKYNTLDLTNGNVQFRTGGRYDRGKPEIKDYAYINTRILIKIEFPIAKCLKLDLPSLIEVIESYKPKQSEEKILFSESAL